MKAISQLGGFAGWDHPGAFDGSSIGSFRLKAHAQSGMVGQASANDDGRAKESIADQWIDFLLKQARAAGEEADQAQPSSAARPSMSSAIRQETPQPGDSLELTEISVSEKPNLESRLAVHIYPNFASYGTLHLSHIWLLSLNQAWVWKHS